MANTFREKELKRKYPVTTGILADSKHEGRKMTLEAQDGSNVPSKDKVLL